MTQLSQADQRRVLEELARRKERLERVDFDKLLFPGPQRNFVLDPSKRKAAVCSRRAGKTYGIVIYALKILHAYSYCQVPYITLTRAQGKRNIWTLLQEMDKKLNLGGKFNNNELTYTLSNGSVFFIIGANDESEIQRLRGGKYPLAMIDEAQSFRPLIRTLIRDILEPAVGDYRGTIILTGTPGPACAGYYWEATTGQIVATDENGQEYNPWSVHHWTLLENPFHPFGEKDVEEVRRNNGWLPDNPAFLREWRGKWVKDDSLKVYKLTEKNLVYNLPGLKLDYVLGIDLGYEDSTAFSVLGYNEQVGKCWVVESWKEQHLIPSAVAARVDRLRERFDFSKIVVDSGGFGKGYLEEMVQRYSIPAEPAEKSNKLAYIELMNGDMQANSLHIIKNRNQELIDELQQLQFRENEDGSPDRTRIDERFEDHLCDSLLYGWRACRQYFYDPQFEAPKANSREYWAQYERDMEEAEVERLSRSESPDFEPPDEAGFLDESLTIEDLSPGLEGIWREGW